jgi:hypothetical protein
MIKHSGAILAAVSIIFVAGCNRGAANNSANKAAPANTANTTAAAPAPAAPAPAAGAPVDAAFLTSSAWGRNGSCAEAATFNADGTFSDKDGPGTWTLQGNTLTVTQNGQPQPATLSRSGDNMIAANPANPAQTLTLTPCVAGAGAAGAGEADAEGGEAEGETAK